MPHLTVSAAGTTMGAEKACERGVLRPYLARENYVRFTKDFEFESLWVPRTDRASLFASGPISVEVAKVGAFRVRGLGLHRFTGSESIS